MAAHPAMQRRAVLAGAIGNTLEWYDFGVYIFLVHPISQLFFPKSEPLTATLLALAIFGSGFLARPLGALLLGMYGDRSGRRAALVLVIFLMAASTFAIGLLPTYQTAGVLAPILLVLLRLVQGFSAGGELAGSAAYLVEYAPAQKRGFYGSWQQFSLGLGLLAGAGAAALVNSTLGTQAVLAWGWRLPFLAGIILGGVGAVLRWGVDETPRFVQAEKQGDLAAAPVRETFTKTKAATAQLFGITVFQAVTSWIVLTYTVTFFITIAKIPPASALQVVVVGLLLFACLAPVTGALSDRIGRKPLMIASCILFILFSYPLFRWGAVADFRTALYVQITLVAMFSLFSGPSPAAFVELFPTRVRYTGVSLAYNVAQALFGGFAPFVAQYLVGATGNTAAPAFYVIAASIIALIVFTRIDETAFQRLR